MTVPVSEKRTALLAAARERILVLDGAMGTMIQGLDNDETAFRGERFKDFHRDVRGNNDLLILTQPKAIEDIHADTCAPAPTSSPQHVFLDLDRASRLRPLRHCL